jgi:dihydrolipoamide dehydrogenase
MERECDMLVIGAGAAGSTAATTAASAGVHVAMIERDKIGGTCLNYGCDPTKALLHTAHMLYEARHADRYGLRIPRAEADWTAVQARVGQVIERIRGGTSGQASAELERKGVEVLEGEAAFVTSHKVRVAGRNISAAQIIVATGSQTLIPPIEGLREAGSITNVKAVSLATLPRRLAIIGGGAIGIEFAQMFHRFGVDVTVLERSSMLLDKEDREMSDALCNLLSEDGIRLQIDAEVLRVQRTGEEKRLTLRCGKRTEEEMIVDEILIAVGRRPTLEVLNLEAAGVKTTKRGIEVDAMLRTSVPHIWAAGDVSGSLQFTHVAYEQGKLAAQNALAVKQGRQPRPFDDSVIPWVTFTDPVLARVGKTEEQLREKGIEYSVGRMKFSEVERAIADDTTEGFCKLLVDEKDMILGGHVLATGGDDLLSPIVLAMHAGIPAKALASTIIPYPTMSEGIRWAADRIG